MSPADPPSKRTVDGLPAHLVGYFGVGAAQSTSDGSLRDAADPDRREAGRRAGAGIPQFAAALAEVDTLGADAAGDAVEARGAEIMALRDARAGYLVAFDYLPAAMQAELVNEVGI